MNELDLNKEFVNGDNSLKGLIVSLEPFSLNSNVYDLLKSAEKEMMPTYESLRTMASSIYGNDDTSTNAKVARRIIEYRTRQYKSILKQISKLKAIYEVSKESVANKSTQIKHQNIL